MKDTGNSRDRMNAEDYRSLGTSGKRKVAYALIVAAGQNGVSYMELRELHLHGAPTDLQKIGMVHRSRRADGTQVYVANKAATANLPGRKFRIATGHFGG